MSQSASKHLWKSLTFYWPVCLPMLFLFSIKPSRITVMAEFRISGELEFVWFHLALYETKVAPHRLFQKQHCNNDRYFNKFPHKLLIIKKKHMHCSDPYAHLTKPRRNRIYIQILLYLPNNQTNGYFHILPKRNICFGNGVVNLGILKVVKKTYTCGRFIEKVN